MKPFRYFAVISLAVFVLAGCNGNQKQAEKIIRSVKLETVTSADSVLEKSFPGSIKEAGEINLAFRVAGPIAQIAVKEGDFVQAGQLIARMDSRDYEIQLQAAQAQYDQVKAEVDRVEELYKRQSVADNDYDKAKTGERMVSAQLKHAKDQLNDTRLLAPSSGYIQKVNFRVNELIDAGMPVATLLDVGHYQVEVDIPVSLYLLKDDIISFSAVQPFMPGKTFDLKLLSFSKKANQNQLYKLQLALGSGARSDLSPGMDVQVNIRYHNNSGPQSCIPLTALFTRDEKSFVWIYQPDSQTVVSREVVPGKLAQKGRIRIDSGLKPGDQVVVAGVGMLDENQKVKPVEAIASTNVGGLL